MDNQIIIDRIQGLCNIHNISPNKLLVDSGAGKDLIANLIKGSKPSVEKLGLVSDYLNCSVDYLLGRTDDPTPPVRAVDAAPPPEHVEIPNAYTRLAKQAYEAGIPAQSLQKLIQAMEQAKKDDVPD